MITISGAQASVDTTGWSPLSASIYERKQSSSEIYSYQSVQHLRFEMEMRNAIVAAAEALSRSGLRFSDFKNSKCNERLWSRTVVGGFRIKEGVPPAEGIRDIFENGRMYATECATATVIVVYKGVLDLIGDTSFNRLFYNLLLYDWHVDDDLRLTVQTGIREAYPGDLRYFSNPDVNPDTPQWQGENVVMIANDLYYGHPFGIGPSNVIIAGLNRVRIPGSETSAYLTDEIVQPDYLYLSRFEPGARPVVFARVGGRNYVL